MTLDLISQKMPQQHVHMYKHVLRPIHIARRRKFCLIFLVYSLIVNLLSLQLSGGVKGPFRRCLFYVERKEERKMSLKSLILMMVCQHYDDVITSCETSFMVVLVPKPANSKSV